MTASYTLMPVPKWYIADLSGLPLGSGYLAAYSSLDETSEKKVWMDASGSSATTWARVPIPNTNLTGILFDENGSQGPFYFEFDTASPDDLYYLEVYDFDGVLQWTIDDFNPGAGSGGSIITTSQNIQNQVINNVMWRNSIGPNLTSTSTFLTIAPGAHSGFSNNAVTTASTPDHYTGPDIVFLKKNTSATDKLQFPLFTLGVNTLAGDTTPVDYCHYECTAAGSSEGVKCIQFPIVTNIQNMSNQAMAVKLWAKSASSNIVTLRWLQFYGDGGAASPTTNPIISNIQLTPQWASYTRLTTVPDAVGGTRGTCGNSALFLQVCYPTDATCSIDFTKLCLYFGNLVPQLDSQTYDVIDGTINSARTGDIKVGFATSVLPGYLRMNDLSIGNTGSAATNRANVDTFPLYNFLYANVLDTWAPVSGGRSGNAVTDFTAGKVMTLPKALGRALCSAGTGSGLTARALGESLGAESVVLTILQLPAHSHEGQGGRDFILSAPGGASTLEGTGDAKWGRNIRTADTGSNQAHPNMQPSSFVNYFIKL